MDSASEPRTSPTLLGRLQRAPADPSAWAKFVDRYGRKIYGWCRDRFVGELPAQWRAKTRGVGRLWTRSRGFGTLIIAYSR